MTDLQTFSCLAPGSRMVFCRLRYRCAWQRRGYPMSRMPLWQRKQSDRRYHPREASGWNTNLARRQDYQYEGPRKLLEVMVAHFQEAPANPHDHGIALLENVLSPRGHPSDSFEPGTRLVVDFMISSDEHLGSCWTQALLLPRHVLSRHSPRYLPSQLTLTSRSSFRASV